MPVALRTASLWLFFAFATIKGDVGIALKFAMPTACVFFPAVGYARMLEKRMPLSYLRRVGYMNAFGYGRLDAVEGLDANDAEMDSGDAAAPPANLRQANPLRTAGSRGTAYADARSGDGSIEVETEGRPEEGGGGPVVV